MNRRIVWRFLGAYLPLILLAVLVLNFFVSINLREHFEGEISQRLGNGAFLIGNILQESLSRGDTSRIQEEIIRLDRRMDVRITVISPDGNVLGDSREDPLIMENHRDRPEVVEAIRSHVGESMRFSDTLNYNMKYVASVVQKEGHLLGIVRLSLPLTEVDAQIRVIYRAVLVGGLVAALFVFVIGYFISRGISDPIREMNDIAQRIAKGDFSQKVSVKTRDELGLLSRSLNTMAEELRGQMENLKKADKIRTDFVANVSHELKTPLTSLKGKVPSRDTRRL